MTPTAPPSSFIIEAVSFGVRALARHGRLMVALAVLHALVAFLIAPWSAPALGALMDAVLAPAASGSPDTAPRTPETDWAPLLGRLPLYLILEFVLVAVTQAALLRALVRDNSAGGVFGIWFGPDEWRVMAVNGIVLLAVVVTAQALFFGVSTLGAAIGALEGGVLAALALSFAAATWLATRLSPAAAMAVGEGAIRLRSTWRMTHGRFGPLFLSLMLAVVAGYMAGLLWSSVAGPPAPAGDAPSLRAAYEAIVADPVGRLRLALAAAVSPFFLLITTGVGAYAYRLWGGAPPAAEPGAPPPA